jgi:soluble lytic murein transglycosylase-like protein
MATLTGISSNAFCAEAYVITPNEIVAFRRAVDPSAIPAKESFPKIRLRQRGNFELRKQLHSMAKQYQINPHFAEAIVTAESAFNVSALSPKGAVGLMQVMPATGKRFGINELWDPIQNMTAGLLYLKFLSDRYDGDPYLVAAGYNAGEGAVERYGNRIPPYQETQRYVQTVMKQFQFFSNQSIQD